MERVEGDRNLLELFGAPSLPGEGAGGVFAEDEDHLAVLQLPSGLIPFKKAHTARLVLSQTG